MNSDDPPRSADEAGASPLSTRTAETGAATRPPAWPLPNLPRRFRNAWRLGSGAFGDVFRVFDDEAQAELALKVLRSAAPAALTQFKHEFRALAAVRHDHLVRLYELLEDQGAWMFTMAYVDGVHFSRAFTHAIDYGLLRSALGQLVDGVSALHDAGFLHRDIKPSNVLITPAGSVMVVDFGLVRSLGASASSDGHVAGTPVYMAPEQLSHGSLTEAADWYSVGVLLYQVLARRAPFDGDLFEILTAKRESDAPSVALTAPDAPADLAAICDALLRRDPVERMTGQAVLNRLHHAARPRVSAPGLAGSWRAHTGAFVGRGRELDLVVEAFGRARSGRPQVVHVAGPSGIGKSAFLSECLDRIRHRASDAIVLPGRCHQTESVPYQGIDEVVEAVAQCLRRMSKTSVDAVLPRNLSMLARVFPALAPLAELFHAAPQEVVDLTEFRVRAFVALRELLGRLAERHPVVVCLDDLQWADLDAFAFVQELMAPLGAPPLLLLAAYRSEEMETVDALRTFRHLPDTVAGYPTTYRIDLSGLDVASARVLVASLLPGVDSRADTPEDLVATIIGEAGGSPFFAHQLVEHLHAVSDSQGPTGRVVSLQQAISARLSTLQPDARAFLETVAVAGRPTASSVIGEAAAVGATLELRHDLVSKRLLRVGLGTRGPTVEVYHDRIREAILAEMLEPRRRQLHARLAAAIGHASGGDDAEQLAFHYEQAGDGTTAAEYALKAARRASTTLAFNRAARSYRQALTLGPGTERDRRITWMELGDVLSSAGRGPEAAEAYLHAADLSERAEQQQLRSRAASQFLRSGHLREGVDLLEAILRQVGIRVPNDRRVLLLRVLLERSRLAAAKRRSSGVPTMGRAVQSADVDLCAAATIGFSMVDPLRSALFSARFVRLALALNEPYRLCLALGCEATQLCHSAAGGAYDEVMSLLGRARALADEIKQPHARAFVRVMSAIVAYLQGRWRAACDDSDAALELLQTRCSGVAWEICTAHTIGFVSRCALGEWSESARRLPGLIHDAQTRGDRYSQHSLRVLGCAHVLEIAADRPEKARRDLADDIAAWSYKYYDIQRAAALIANVDIAIYENQPERAVAVVRDEWPGLKRSMLLRLPTTFAFTHAARARAALALAARTSAVAERRALVAEAAASTRAIDRGGPSWSRGIVELLQAGMASCAGHRELSVRHLTAAEAALETSELTPLLMAARWRLAALHRDGAHSRRLRSVTDWVSAQEIQRPDAVLATMAPGDWS